MLCLSVHLLICFQSTIGGTYLSMPVSQLFPDMGSGTLFPGEVCNRAKGKTTWGLFPRIHSPILPVLLRVSLFAQCPFPCLVSSLAWQLSNCFESGGDVRLSWTSLVYSWVDVASLWKKILPAIPIYSWIAGRFYCCCLDHQCSSFNCPATLWHSEQSGEQFSSMWWWPLLPQQIRAGTHHWDCFSVCYNKDQIRTEHDTASASHWVSAKSLCSHHSSVTQEQGSLNGAELPQSSAPKQANFAQNRYRVKIATTCKFTDTNAKAVVLHLLVAITGNKQCISVVLRCDFSTDFPLIWRRSESI